MVEFALWLKLKVAKVKAGRHPAEVTLPNQPDKANNKKGCVNYSFYYFNCAIIIDENKVTLCLTSDCDDGDYVDENTKKTV